MNKPFSEACERNKEPILEILQALFRGKMNILEIGSGTGQHAVFFAAALPDLVWQTSDLAGNHDGIRAWIEESKLPNILPPLDLDISKQPWQIENIDAVYTANTCHIISAAQVKQMFEGTGRLLKPDGMFCIYGPFNYNGKYTSPGNEQFDRYLRETSPVSGIRDFSYINSLATDNGFRLENDFAMPANNRLLVFRKI